MSEQEDKDTGNSANEPEVWLPTSRTELGRRIKYVIDRAGSFQLAAEITHKSVMQLRRYVSGESEPPFLALTLLCDATGTSLQWLAAGTGDPHPKGGAQSGVAVKGSHKLDKWLFSRVIDGIRRVYRQTGAQLPTVNEVDLGVDMHDRIAAIAASEEAKLGALAMALDQLERELLEKGRRPVSGKQSA